MLYKRLMYVQGNFIWHVTLLSPTMSITFLEFATKCVHNAQPHPRIFYDANINDQDYLYYLYTNGVFHIKCFTLDIELSDNIEICTMYRPINSEVVIPIFRFAINGLSSSSNILLEL